jgi:hypothetical protein
LQHDDHAEHCKYMKKADHKAHHRLKTVFAEIASDHRE